MSAWFLTGMPGRRAEAGPPPVSDIDQTALAGRWRPSRAESCWSDNGVTQAVVGGLVYRVDDEISTNHLLQATALERPTLAANMSPAQHQGILFALGKTLTTTGGITTTDTTYYWVGLFVPGADSLAFSRLDVPSGGISGEYVYFANASLGAAADAITATRGTTRSIQPAAGALPTVRIGVVALVVDAGSNVKLYVDGVLIGTNASSPGVTALTKRVGLNVWAPGFNTYSGANICLELDLYSVAHDATAVAANSAILLAKYNTLGVWTPASISAAKLPVWAEARDLTPFASGTTLGSGAVASGGNAGLWADGTSNNNHMIQATGSQKPVVRKHATKGKGAIVMGTGEVGAGGDFLATAANIANIKYAFLVATPIGPNLARTALPDPYNRWNDNFHGFLGTAPISASAVLFTGNNGSNNWGQYALASYARDGVLISTAAADVGYGRKRYVYRVSLTGVADTGALNVLRHVGYDGFYARGGVHGFAVATSSANAGELAQIESFMESYWLSGPQVIFAGDSLMAGYNLLETQGPPALLWEAYEGSVDCPCIAVPGQGFASSISPLAQTMAVNDPAKVSSIKGQHTNVIVALAGTNDLFNGRTSVQLLADVQAYTAAAKALGHKVIVGTIAPRSDAGWTVGMEAQRVAYNTALRASHAWADGFVDVDVIAPALQADGVHWTIAGTADVTTGAGGIKVAVDALI